MDYNKIAKEIINCVGGKENITGAMHCATRLRLNLVDESKVDEESLTDIDVVKGTFLAKNSPWAVKILLIPINNPPATMAGIIGTKISLNNWTARCNKFPFSSTFLPVLIGFSATKKFGGNPYLGAALGMIMVHPDLLNAYSYGKAGVEVPVWNIFGLSIEAVGYQGTVLPVLGVSWILANIEKRLHKVTPTFLFVLFNFFTSISVQHKDI